MFALLLSLCPFAEASPPNVVVILADDVGYGDLGCYGSTKVPSPNLDKLAEGGMRFTDAHSPASVCTPTRYALLTGQYAWRHPPGARILSGVAPLCIPPAKPTIGSHLKSAGYATSVVGKWHLGLGDPAPDYNAEIKPGPREVGFDESFIIPATGDRTPCVFVANGRVVGLDPNDPISVNYAKKIGAEPTGKENPELLFNQKPSHGHDMTIVNGISRIGWMSGGNAARWKDEDIADVITKQATAFIERKREKPFFLYFATHDAHVPRFPHPRFRGKSGHGLRGDAIVELDWCVGEIMSALDRIGATNDTLVIFTSDNGGVMDDGYVDGTGSDASGHRCNGPLRGFKGGLYEGGHRVPFIVRWPGEIPQGKVSNELICHVDLLATIAGIAGRPLPSGAGPDSVNVLRAFTSEKPESPCRSSLVHQAGGGALSSEGKVEIDRECRTTECRPRTFRLGSRPRRDEKPGYGQPGRREGADRRTGENPRMMEALAELRRLLTNLQPVLNPGSFAFRSMESDAVPTEALAWFRESEGLSVIVPAGEQDGAKARFAWITLGVESPLAAVGLTAVVATALAAEGIACNVVAAVWHDHLFVPFDRSDDAMAVLQRLQEEA